MAMNPMAMLQAQERMDLFNREHPKVMPFLEALQRHALIEGTVLEIKAVTPDGRDYISNIRLTENDIKTVKMLTGKA